MFKINSIYNKPVTCSKGSKHAKVPLAAKGHKW